MNILCLRSLRSQGLGRVFRKLGHNFVDWSPSETPVFDAFNQAEPDIFIGDTAGIDRATIKNILSRPQIKVVLNASYWGKLHTSFVPDEQERRMVAEVAGVSLLVANVAGRFLEGVLGSWTSLGVKLLGLPMAADTFVYAQGQARPEFRADIAYVGSYARKADRLNQHIGGFGNSKIFGNWIWPYPEYLGYIEERELPDLFVSATVCPNVSTPLASTLGFGLSDRPYKILASGGFCISDHVEEAKDLFTDTELPMRNTAKEFRKTVQHFIKNQGSSEAGRKRVLAEHTYFDRAATLLNALGMGDEAARVVQTKKGCLP